MFTKLQRRMAASVGTRYVRHMTDPTFLPNFPPPPGERPLRGRMLSAVHLWHETITGRPLGDCPDERMGTEQS
jgi:hypothetical protein